MAVAAGRVVVVVGGWGGGGRVTLVASPASHASSLLVQSTSTDRDASDATNTHGLSHALFEEPLLVPAEFMACFGACIRK